MYLLLLVGQRSNSYHDCQDLQGIRQAPYKAYFGRSEVIPQQPLSPNKPKVVDATHIIKQPHRVNRPDHIVIILRGLPGLSPSLSFL